MSNKSEYFDLSFGHNDEKVQNNMRTLTGNGNIKGMKYFSSTVDFASVAAGADGSTDITCTGVALGDIVLGFSIGVDVVDLQTCANVTAADTVTVVLKNDTAGAIDLASTTVRILVADVT